MDFISDWFRRHIADRQLVILILVMASVAIVIYFAGGILAPVFAAVVIAYLLNGAINRLERLSVPHGLAFALVFLTALAVAMLAGFGLLPLLIREVTALLQQVPTMMSTARRLLSELPSQYPDLISTEQINELFSSLNSELLRMGQRLLSYSFTSAITAFTVLVYVILVPFMVFFMVRDKELILNWLLGFLPEERSLTNKVWRDVDNLIDRYIQGKVAEIIIVGGVAYVVFLFLGLDYSLLLAAVTGLSVVIPYIGAFVVTIPVAFVAFYQFGWSAEFAYVIAAYTIIQALDGNVLVPLLFGEAVNLHPVAIIIAILFFGGIWGFWGVFFAIPLATVISAVISAWPDLSDLPEELEAHSSSDGDNTQAEGKDVPTLHEIDEESA